MKRHGWKDGDGQYKYRSIGRAGNRVTLRVFQDRGVVRGTVWIDPWWSVSGRTLDECAKKLEREVATWAAKLVSELVSDLRKR